MSQPSLHDQLGPYGLKSRWLRYEREKTAVKLLTDTMNITLHTSREVIIDNLPHALEIHTSGHDFRTDHHPALASAHSAHGVISFLLAHPCMKAIHVWNRVQDELFCERRRTRLGGWEDENWRVVGLCEVGKETREF